jgi:hypothetical protein
MNTLLQKPSSSNANPSAHPRISGTLYDCSTSFKNDRGACSGYTAMQAADFRADVSFSSDRYF